MNITHVIMSMDPAGGGPPQVAARLAAAQAALGHHLTIISQQPADAAPRVREMTRSIPGFEPVQLRANLSPSQLSQTLERQDFVHLHGAWGALLLKAARICRKHGVPYTLTPHGMLDPWSLSQKRLKKKLALLLGYRKMLNGAAFLHMLNKDEADLIRPLGLLPGSEIIGNGVFLDEIDPLPQPGTFRAAFPDLVDTPYILFLSRLHYKKGLDILGDAFAKLTGEFPSVKLVVAGPDGGAGAAFSDQVERLGIAERVILTGPIYGELKYAALVDSACFCLPSRQEGFSIAILEALACAVPVVITDNCHFPEVNQAGAGAMVACNADAVAEGLRSILADPDEAVNRGRFGRKLVEDQYQWSRIAEQLLEAYCRTTEKTKSSS